MATHFRFYEVTIEESLRHNDYVSGSSFLLQERLEDVFKKIFIAPVRFYQKFISPMFPSSCRYHPTCSQYMIDAINYHGAFQGVIMGTGRILRCHPLVKGGIDYVPRKFTLRRNPSEEYTGPYTYKKNKQ